MRNPIFPIPIYFLFQEFPSNSFPTFTEQPNRPKAKYYAELNKCRKNQYIPTFTEQSNGPKAKYYSKLSKKTKIQSFPTLLEQPNGPKPQKYNPLAAQLMRNPIPINLILYYIVINFPSNQSGRKRKVLLEQERETHRAALG